MCRRGVQLSGPVLMVAEDQNEAGRGSAAGGMGSIKTATTPPRHGGSGLAQMIGHGVFHRTAD
jgi:hypothetical protein